MAENRRAARRLEWGETGAVDVETVAEMDAVIDRLSAEAGSHPMVIELTVPSGATLSIGIGREVTVRNYVDASLEPPYRGDWSEYPPGSPISIEEGREALRKFFVKGELAAGVEWQEV
jgi:hypothetical protein